MNFLFPYSEQKIKAQLKMASHRINVSNNKRTNAAKHAKREIATLLTESKDEKALIKAEHIIREDFLIESYELLGLLCELIYERIPQITSNKECPLEMRSAVCSVIWAAEYVDFPELKEVASQLTKKYGDTFAKIARANENKEVNERLFSKLVYRPPSKKLVVKYLNEIAKAYGVDYELDEEVDLEDESVQPFSAPSGFSIPMAPGSGLSDAYSTAPQTHSQTLNADEHAEYEQFLRNQASQPQIQLQQQQPQQQPQIQPQLQAPPQPQGPFPAVSVPPTQQPPVAVASLVYDVAPAPMEKTLSAPPLTAVDVSSVDYVVDNALEENENTHNDTVEEEQQHQPAPSTAGNGENAHLDDLLARLEALKK